MLSKNNASAKIWAIVLTLLIAVGLVMPMGYAMASPGGGSGGPPPQPYPTVVDGRILTPEMTGDISNWVEIAQYGNYSLIVRANFLNLQSFNYGDPLWQSARWQTPKDGTSNVGYTRDNVSRVINCWFNFFEVIPDPQGINTYYDVLPENARLRDFTMQHNALSTLGTRYSSTNLVDGLSIPTIYQVGVGNNIAFCLSYSEAAGFVSLTRNFPGANSTTYLSPPEAVANFGKINLPAQSSVGYYFAMWLRSPGNHSATQSAMLSDGYCHELDVLNTPSGNLPNNHAFGYGLIYPAVWVDQGIFYTPPEYPTVTGRVWPMLANDIWGLGEAFVRSHDITVELRSTFLTPAPANLSTKAVLVDSSGLGEFTFENVPYGNYVLHIDRPGYLTRAMLVSVSEASPAVITLSPPGIAEGGVFRLWWGDSNDDGRIDNEDVMMILELMNLGVNANHPYYYSGCDFNSDGLIDNEDIQMVLEMWNRMLLDYPGSNGVNPFN
ncbi:MAG: dockerin type I domain-containing protein [Oscillospiraceae bacterium]|nr:dockerin type I domain-containing protein [Oscillospiraceae bacterium]